MSSDVIRAAALHGDADVEERSGDSTSVYAGLAERARAGDAEAFDRLMVLTQRKVVATAWRMLGNREDARDAAQEAYLRAFKYLDRYDARQDFQGWLHRIVVNVCRDAARRRGSQEVAFETERDVELLESVAGSDDTEAGAIRAQERAIVARALATLSHGERAALVLRDLENRPTEEVALILGSRPVTVRSQLCSARAKIKKYCERLLAREAKR